MAAPASRSATRCRCVRAASARCSSTARRKASSGVAAGGEFPRRRRPRADRPALRRSDRPARRRALPLLRALFAADRRLYVSWHEANDAGDLTPRSLFVDELCDCFAPALFDERRTRPAGALGWPGDERSALLGAPRRRAGALAPLADPQRLAALRARRAHSASGLERWARCPVAWLVEHGLRPSELAPDSIWLTRGNEAHRVLATVFAGLEGGRLGADSLPRALELLDAAIGRTGSAALAR